MLVGIVALAVPNIIGHLLRSVGFMVPPAGALGIAIWVLNCMITVSFWLVGMGAIVATRAGMPPRLVPAVGVPGTAPPPPAPPTPAAPAAAPIEPTAPPPATA
jgi:hypothetical protein